MWRKKHSEGVQMPSKRVDPAVALLLEIVDQAFLKKAWHGPNLRGSIRGLTAREAAWRPRPGRHNIWEIVVHAAYWKYAVRRRIRGDRKGSFALKGSNWFHSPITSTEAAWRRDVQLLEQEHAVLREAIAGLPAKELHQPARGSKTSNAVLVYGIACHDVYHAGQIQLLKRLLRSRKRG
jgi:hypothetical protein